MTSGIVREPASPSMQPVIPSAHAPAPSPTETVGATTDDPAKNDTLGTPREPDRAGPTTRRDRAKPSAVPSADELLERALSARGGGDVKTATGLLESLRTAHPGSSQAAIAAAYLGRDAARSGQRDTARRWFEVYLEEQPSGPLEREASGQLIELTTGAEQLDRARGYLARHPDGPHAPLAKRVLAGAR
jgi:hypothetical protein